MKCLLADIGGTHARFAILQNGKMSDIYRYRCSDFKSAYQAIQSFLLTCDIKPESAIIAMAGAVKNGIGKWTNLPWDLCEQKLKNKFGFRKVKLVNDLIPQGAGITVLSGKDIRPLNRVKPEKNAVKVLICMGTGLGCCIMTDSEIYPSEYGQTLLPDGRILERVLSSTGLKQAYEDNTGKRISAHVIEQRLNHGRNAAVDAYAALYMALGRAAQNLMLIAQPFGGLYLAGGMLSERSLKQMKIIDTIQHHPTMSKLLKRMPVFYVANKDLAFVGLKKLAKKYDLT